MISRHSDRSLPDPNLEPTITVPRAGRILGMSRNAAYAAARDGRLPTVAISPTRVVVVTAEFLERYRLRRVPGHPAPRTPSPAVVPSGHRAATAGPAGPVRHGVRHSPRPHGRPDPHDRPPLDAA